MKNALEYGLNSGLKKALWKESFNCVISLKGNHLELMVMGFIYFSAVGRGFPDRMRPPGDRYQEPPRDRGAPWDPERRRDREHPRDRSRPHDESRDRERKPRGEVSPGRGPRHFEDKRGGWYFVCLVVIVSKLPKTSPFSGRIVSTFPYQFWRRQARVPMSSWNTISDRTGAD